MYCFSYQKAVKEFVKLRHLLANMPKPSFNQKRQLEAKEISLQEMRTKSTLKREVTVDLSSKGFIRTGIMCDIVQVSFIGDETEDKIYSTDLFFQHALLIPVLVRHLRFHQSLDTLETTLGYKFQNRFLLQLAMTHPSYK